MDWSSHDRAVVSDGGGVSCVTGSTAIDALRLALGSTLGAFIALAVVVAFVLLAKCQHRRRVRRRRCRRHGRRYSDKSQPLTDSDNVSFFDYYDDNDDDYGSVFIDDGQKDHEATGATTGSPPVSFSLCDKTRLIFTDEFVATEDRDVARREWNVGDMSAQFYDAAHDREAVAETDRPRAETFSTQYGQIAAETHIKSAFDSGAASPAIFVSGVLDDDKRECSVVGEGFRVAASSLSLPRCFSRDVDDAFAASEALRPATVTQPAAARIVDVTTSDCRDTTGLLSASDVIERTPGGLKPNHYSSLW